MKNGLLLICYIFSTISICFAQIDEFGTRYREAAASLLKTDHSEALRLLDSLSSEAKSDEQRMMSSLLLAALYEDSGALDKAIWHATKADHIAKASFNFTWQTHTAVFLARAYRDIGLLTCSRRHLDQAEVVNEKQRETANYAANKVNILQEKILHAFEQEAYHAALTYVLEAGIMIDLIKQDTAQRQLKARNVQWAGVCQFYLGNIALADSLFSNAQTELLAIGDTRVLPYVYRWKAEVALAGEDEALALQYLEKTALFLQGKNMDKLKIAVYDSYSKYYWRVGNADKTKEFSERAAKLKEERTQIAKRISDNLIDNLSKSKESFKNRYVIAGMLALSVIILLACVLFYLFLLRRAELGKATGLAEEAPIGERQQPGGHIEKAPLEDKDTVAAAKDINISKETEERLLSKLNEYEEQLFFLSKNISLVSMAKELETNQRYISFLIRKYRNKDFYGYIQMSRIQYIISRIKADESLLDVKLAHLASMAGFPNQSKFSIAFKAETGFPPSAFIHFTKMEREKAATKVS